MNINIKNVPKALWYFLIGTALNIMFYYTFSPTQVDLFGILSSIFIPDDTLAGVLWIGIMTISIALTLILPVWTLLEGNEEQTK